MSYGKDIFTLHKDAIHGTVYTQPASLIKW